MECFFRIVFKQTFYYTIHTTMCCTLYTFYTICHMCDCRSSFRVCQYAQWKICTPILTFLSSSFDVFLSCSRSLLLSSNSVSIYLFYTRSSLFDFSLILLSHTATAAAAASVVVSLLLLFSHYNSFCYVSFDGLCVNVCTYVVITHQCHFERWKSAYIK